jgi:hypothetical protein
MGVKRGARSNASALARTLQSLNSLLLSHRNCSMYVMRGSCVLKVHICMVFGYYLISLTRCRKIFQRFATLTAPKVRIWPGLQYLYCHTEMSSNYEFLCV